jgi:parallel beta-helix repeat protein
MGSQINGIRREGGTATLLAMVAAVLVVSVGSITQVFAATVGCGDVITTDTTLTADITGCMGAGLIIGADNITLDCAGHSIVGANLSYIHYGVQMARPPVPPETNIVGVNGVTVQNCDVSSFYNGIYLYNSANNNIIRNNTLHDNTVAGIRLAANISSNEIYENECYNNSNSGIYLGPLKYSPP